MNKIDSREAALEILDQAREQNQRLSEVRDFYFKQYSLSGPDRNRVTSLTQEVSRWQGRLDYWLSGISKRPLKSLQPRLLILLRLATLELLMDRINPEYAIVNSWVELSGKRVGAHVKGLVNAILRKMTLLDPTKEPAEKHDSAVQAAWYSCPEWLWIRWVNRHGQEFANNLCQYQNQLAPLTIRRDANKINAEDLVRTLKSAGVNLERYSDTDIFFKAANGGSILREHDLFRNGSYSFQDRAAGAVVEILAPQPDEVILDVCAAPGTKTVYIAELMGRDSTNQLYAYDIDSDRVSKAIDDNNRHGWDNITWAVTDASVADLPEADAVLVDVPCTGTGVIGRRPDIRWRRQLADIAEMAQLQFRILKNVSRAVKTGGRLVYSTCSLEPEENWNVVAAFLKFNPRFSIENIDQLIPDEWINPDHCMETFPPRDRVDGIFTVRLKSE